MVILRYAGIANQADVSEPASQLAVADLMWHF
jgi:hypothetical protein